MNNHLGYKEHKVLFKKGKRFYNVYYSLFCIPHHREMFCVGSKKKVGNACVRNKEKRHLRFFLREFNFKEPNIVLVVCHKQFLGSFEKKRKILWYLFSQIEG